LQPRCSQKTPEQPPFEGSDMAQSGHQACLSDMQTQLLKRARIRCIVTTRWIQRQLDTTPRNLGGPRCRLLSPIIALPLGYSVALASPQASRATNPMSSDVHPESICIAFGEGSPLFRCHEWFVFHVWRLSRPLKRSSEFSPNSLLTPLQPLRDEKRLSHTSDGLRTTIVMQL
jgi:hypothetical protein